MSFAHVRFHSELVIGLWTDTHLREISNTTSCRPASCEIHDISAVEMDTAGTRTWEGGVGDEIDGQAFEASLCGLMVACTVPVGMCVVGTWGGLGWGGVRGGGERPSGDFRFARPTYRRSNGHTGGRVPVADHHNPATACAVVLVVEVVLRLYDNETSASPARPPLGLLPPPHTSLPVSNLPPPPGTAAQQPQDRGRAAVRRSVAVVRVPGCRARNVRSELTGAQHSTAGVERRRPAAEKRCVRGQNQNTDDGVKREYDTW